MDAIIEPSFTFLTLAFYSLIFGGWHFATLYLSYLSFRGRTFFLLFFPFHHPRFDLTVRYLSFKDSEGILTIGCISLEYYQTRFLENEAALHASNDQFWTNVGIYGIIGYDDLAKLIRRFYPSRIIFIPEAHIGLP